MTVANDLKIESGNTLGAGLRRCAANVVASLARLVHKARFQSEQPWLLAPRKLAMAAAVAIVVFLFVLVFFDAAAITAAQQLPRWLISFFDWVTDFGKSGWFLWPLGIPFLALAALPSNSLTRISQCVVAAVMVRVGFLFVAIAVPGLFTDSI
jgi:hypothetical protein